MLRLSFWKHPFKTPYVRVLRIIEFTSADTYTAFILLQMYDNPSHNDSMQDYRHTDPVNAHRSRNQPFDTPSSLSNALADPGNNCDKCWLKLTLTLVSNSRQWQSLATVFKFKGSCNGSQWLPAAKYTLHAECSSATVRTEHGCDSKPVFPTSIFEPPWRRPRCRAAPVDAAGTKPRYASMCWVSPK